VQDDSEARKLNAIVGSAIKALAESGAEDELVGAFAAAHREKVARILGTATGPDQPPDLAMTIAQGVKAALEQMGFSAAREKARRISVTVGGRKTTVSVRESRLAKLADQVGGLPKARAIIGEMAQSAPDGLSNRSAWIEERIAAFEQPTPVPGDASVRH